MGKSSLFLFFFFSLSGYPTVWVAISCELPQIALTTFRPGPYPKHEARTSLFSPCWLLVNSSICATSPLGVTIRHVICFFFFPPFLCCPPRFQNYLQACWWEGSLVFWNFFSFTTPSLGWVSILNSFVSLFVFYILSYLLLKEWAAFLGAWCPLLAFRSCSVDFAQRSNDLLMICGGDSDLSVLFLHHLRIAPLP